MTECKQEKIKKRTPVASIKKSKKKTPAVVESYERVDDLDGTHYAYSAHELFTQRDKLSKRALSAPLRKALAAVPPYAEFDDDNDAFHKRYAALLVMLRDDNKVEEVSAFLRADAHRGEWVTSDFACSRVIDMLLAVAVEGGSTNMTIMLVDEFGANPGQTDASNAMSAVQYADEGSSKRAHLMQLAREFEHRRGWFALLKKVEIKQ